MKHYSEKIREIRKSKYMTQEQLEEKSGISSSVISDIENRKHRMYAETMCALARALEISPCELCPEGYRGGE